MVVGVWLLQWLVLPVIARRQIASILSGIGLSGAQFEVREVTLFGARVTGITAGEGGFRVGRVSVTYQPWGVIAGHVDTVDIAGAELQAKIKDGRFEMGWLDQSPGGTSATHPVESHAKKGKLPFRQINLRSCALVIDLEGRELYLPIQGEVRSEGEGGRIELRAYAQSALIELNGELDSSSNLVWLTASARGLELSSLLSATPRAAVAFGHFGGLVDMTADYHRDGPGATLTATANLRNAWYLTPSQRAMWMPALNASVEARLAAGHLEGAHAKLSAQSFEIIGEQLTDLLLDATYSDDKMAVTGSGRWGDLRLTNFKGEVTRLAENGTIAALLGYSVEGRLPALARSLLAAAGLGAEQFGAVTLAGTLDASMQPRAGASPEWSIEAREHQFIISPGWLVLPGGMRLAGVQGQVNFKGDASPRGIDVFLREDSSLGYSELQQSTGKHLGGGVALAISRQEVKGVSRPVFHAAGDLSTRSLAFGVDATDGVGLTLGGSEVRLPRLGVEFAAESGGRLSVRAMARFGDAEMRIPAAAIALTGISADIPFSVNAATPPGGFAIAGVSVAGHPLPGLSGGISTTTNRIDLSAVWPLLPQATLRAGGFVESDVDGPRGDFYATMAGIKLTEAAAVGRLVPALAGSEVTGTLALDARLELSHGQLYPWINLSADNARLASAQYDASVEDVAFSITLDSLNWSTPGDQWIKTGAAKVGKLAVHDGMLRFRVEGPKSVFVEQTDFGWGGGRLYAHAVRINPSSPKFDMVVYADSVRVKDVLDLTAEGKVTGSGTLYGRIPVMVDWPRLGFGEGFLYATPGEGALQFGETAHLVADQLPADSQQTAEVRSRLLESLQDYRYDILKVNLTNQGRDLVAKIDVDGKGSGSRGLQIGLTVTARGVDALLNSALVVQRMGK